MPSTFNNVDTAALAMQWAEATLEAERIRVALAERLLEECPIKIGQTYIVAHGRYAGRVMLVTGMMPYFPDAYDLKNPRLSRTVHVDIFGRLNIVSKSVVPTGDNFGRRIAVATPDQLTPTAETQSARR